MTESIHLWVKTLTLYSEVSTSNSWYYTCSCSRSSGSSIQLSVRLL